MLLLALVTAFLTTRVAGQTDLLITGVAHGPLPVHVVLPNNTDIFISSDLILSDTEIPQAIELYAINPIANLSEYALGSGNDGQETILQGTADARQFLYVANDAASFNSFFFFTPDFVGTAAALNGSEAIELFRQGEVVDVFGNITINNGAGTPWNYVDGWAYRRDTTGPDNDTFVLSNWILAPDVFLTAETNLDVDVESFPISTYSRTPSQPTPAPDGDDGDDEGANQGEIAGAIIGVLCAVVLIGAIACYCRRKQILAKTAGTAATAVNPNNVSSSAAELGIVPESGI